MDYNLGTGPTLPGPDEVFGMRDQQMVVTQGKVNHYFELGVDGTKKSRTLEVLTY